MGDELLLFERGKPPSHRPYDGGVEFGTPQHHVGATQSATICAMKNGIPSDCLAHVRDRVGGRARRWATDRWCLDEVNPHRVAPTMGVWDLGIHNIM